MRSAHHPWPSFSNATFREANRSLFSKQFQRRRPRRLRRLRQTGLQTESHVVPGIRGNGLAMCLWAMQTRLANSNLKATGCLCQEGELRVQALQVLGFRHVKTRACDLIHLGACDLKLYKPTRFSALSSCV